MRTDIPLLHIRLRDFPGSSVVMTPGVHCQGPGSIPSWGTKTHVQPKQERKEKRIIDARTPILRD